jgi:hypothetical protein
MGFRGWLGDRIFGEERHAAVRMYEEAQEKRRDEFKNLSEEQLVERAEQKIMDGVSDFSSFQAVADYCMATALIQRARYKQGEKIIALLEEITKKIEDKKI